MALLNFFFQFHRLTTQIKALALGLSLTHSQCEPIRTAAKEFVQSKLPLVLEEVCQSPLKDTPPVLHELLVYVRTHSGCIPERLKQDFYAHVIKSFNGSVPLVLRPLLPVKTVPEQLDEPLIKMDFQSLPDLLREVGYAATASVPDCQKILQVCSCFDNRFI